MDPIQLKNIRDSILSAHDLCRAGVMDVAEQALGDSTDWQFVRSRLLRAFGNKAGFEGRIHQIFSRYLPEEEQVR